ncbi:MAG: TonB-dependent receptor [Prevotella sp.]|nr:TonB-dependent receptor [Prevotella sp.]
MSKKLKFLVFALCFSSAAIAQEEDSLGVVGVQDEQAFTFTEAQLGEDDDMSQNVTIVNSNNNIYASQVGYLFSPVRFRYRAFNQKYNEIFINGVPMNDMETGQFRFSLVGGLNQQTRDVEHSLPFENNGFSMSAMGGSNNYNFRPSHFATGQRLTLTGANRNYTLRGMYTYNSGILQNGWAFSANLTYRWADMNTGYVEGTFYNSLSYFLGAEKFIGDKHHISIVTWGNPTERAGQGAATDECYWLANDRYYNPYWGYQNGKKRNSRVVNDFAPTLLATWDWQINERTKLTTAVTGRYSMYKSTKLNYNNADNPHPDYWKNMPSSYYDVWGREGLGHLRTEQAQSDWLRAKTIFSGYKEDRQINFDRLYAANHAAAAQGQDAMYYIQAKHNDNLNIALASSLNKELNRYASLNLGVQLATNKGMHYQTMDDLMGAQQFHNINTYALGKYAPNDPRIQYDTNNPNGIVKEGDKFGYDYNLFVNKAAGWLTFKYDRGRVHSFISGRVAGVEMQREGKMSNGMGFVQLADGTSFDNSFGKSKKGKFLEGGGKIGFSFNLGKGNAITLGGGYEQKAPQASTAFVSPEINNDFVVDLKNEKVLSGEVGYQLQTSWLKANISGYYSQVKDATEWQNFYFDDINSFSYVSMTGINKEYYGVEWGLNFKLTSAFNIKTLGTISEAKNTNNARVWYMSSTDGTYNDNNDNQPEMVLNKNMREAGTPLTALSLILSYHQGGWFIDVNGNYYDRIYLSYSPCYRYESTLKARQKAGETVMDNAGNVLMSALEQEKGHGGFMLDLSIGKSIWLKHGRSMSINLSVTNLLNNQNIVTGGYEQSRSDYTASSNMRAYSFARNPKKYYAYGINGMLNIAYKF